MLSFKFISNSGGAAHYFENSDDYYAKEGHKGEWEGNGAKALGLDGGVDSAVFKHLLDGVLPSGEVVRRATTKAQGNGKKTKPRLGIDFTFSAPKSVSIAALVTHDHRLLQAHDEAVKTAIKMLEAKVVARKKERGLSFRQHTNNLIVATFRHDLSRTQDPQLHTHAVTMNLTQRDDGKWVALTNDEMLKAVKVVGAYYRADLAQRLEAMGYDLRSTKHGFELSSVSEAAIKLFSQRSKQIEERLTEMKLDRDSANSKTKQTVTQATRPNKTDADRAELRQEWLDMLKQAGIDLQKGDRYRETKQKIMEKAEEIGRAVMPDRVWEGIDRRREEKLQGNAERAVNFAIEHLMERQGIFSKSELLEQAFLKGLGAHNEIEAEVERAQKDGRLITELPLFQSAKSFSREKLKEAGNKSADLFKQGSDLDKLSKQSWVAMAMANGKLDQAAAEKLVEESIQNGRLVSVEERFTTGEMLKSEQKILRMEEMGRGQVLPVMTPEDAAALLSTTNLNAGQREAANLILTSSNRFVGVQGFAGVGKSHMMSKSVEAIKQEAIKVASDQGWQVIGLAPYGSQNKALAELGLKSQTLTSFLLKKDEGALTPKTLIMLDEASVVPVHQMRAIMERVERAGARLVLLGDRKQTQAVEAGKPFEQLQDAGMSTAHITEIQRQRDAQLKAAVISAAHDRIGEAVKVLATKTVEIRDAGSRYDAIAKDYVALDQPERDRTLIVAGTNEARKQINEVVREKLNLPGGEIVATLDSVDLTRAQMKEAGSFAPGQIIISENGAGQGMRRGKNYEVVAVDDKANQLSVRNDKGETLVIDAGKMGAVSAYTPETVKVSEGDWIRLTRADKEQDLANGERYQVAAVTPDVVILSNGAKLSRKKRLHLRHGYAATVHSAQGLTTKRVLIDADTKSATSNRAVFYVGISRPTEHLKVYTNDKKQLAEAMDRQPKKYAALELRDGALEQRMREHALSRQALSQAARQANVVRQRQGKAQPRLKFK